ncbi:MAG TPA: Ig-like domain-containing protein, partial [Gaiellaceae bacterium]|nr:Ig-like domain-containing protein [Gaiellaceae bacterium]
VTSQIDNWTEQVTRAIGDAFTADQAATLIRLAQKLKPDYSPLANNTVDPRGTGPSFADIAYGGAGHDILIANTASDRLIGWQHDANAFYVPWEGDAGHTVISSSGPDDVTQFLYDLGLALGADPTLSPVVASPWGHGDQTPYQNGEPFGELGLLQTPDENWLEHNDLAAPWTLEDGTNPGIHPEGAPDLGSLSVFVPLTPSAHPQLIDSIRTVGTHPGHLEETAQALLNRIVVRGQLTAAEVAALSQDGAAALADLIAGGLVAAAGDGYAATDATWLALGLANPPQIAELDHHATTTESAGVRLTGTGDAGDTITVYAGMLVLGTTLVAADGTWSLTVFPPVGEQSLTATQTVNELPHVGLTSGRSKDVEITVLPDAPGVSSIPTPGPAAPTAPVTLTGTGDAGDTIALYDGGRRIGGTVVAADGSWTLTVALSPGTHTLAATQSAPCADHHCDPLTSPASLAQTVTVYAPPPAPSLTVPSPANVTSPFTIGGHGVAGDTVNVDDAGALVATALVAADGTWSLLLDLPLGPHPLSVTQTDPASTFTGAATATATVTVYATPPAPAIVSVSTPAPTTSTTPVTVSGTGVAGDTVTLYDGGIVRGTTVVAAGGTWTLTIELGVGVHSLTATQTVAPGVTGPAGAAVSVTVLPPPPVAPTLSAPAVAPVAPLALGGHGVAGDTITLYDGVTAIGTTTVAGNGSWSLTVSLALGTHTLAATQTDPVWNLTSALGAAVTVNVVPTPPAPVIVSAETGRGHGGHTPVTVTGTGVAGETVTLYDGNDAVGTVTVAADGSWALTVDLRDGGHTLTATEALSAGPSSDSSAAYDVEVGHSHRWRW